MGQQHSTNEVPLYQHINDRNVEGIKALFRGGADIERIDSEGRTPLIFSCLNPEFYMVTKTLIELGANVNAYRSGRLSGTPLHHAAKKGLHRTVKLLLSHGANAFTVNDDAQTLLELARALGHSSVVRTIENHISFFSGWMRYFSAVGSAQVLVSAKIWVAVTPCSSPSLTSPVELELNIYSSLQEARPRITLALAKAYIAEPRFHETDPTVVLTCVTTNEDLKLGPAKVGDMQQLQWFLNSCRGIPPAMYPAALSISILHAPIVAASAPPFDLSIYDDEAGPSTFATNVILNGENDNLVALPQVTPMLQLPNDSVGTDLYPPITSFTDFQTAHIEPMPSVADNIKKPKEESNCVICENAPVEGACVPCGHMAGCMECLNKIMKLNLGCPICRSKIDQVVRLFAV